MRQIRPVIVVTVVLMVGLGSAAYGGDGLVKLSSAAPACSATGAERFVDCGDGTVADMDTGMVWLANADCIHLYIGNVSWADAVVAVAALSDGMCGLTDGSSPGDWRLPTNAELNTLISSARALNCGPASSPCITNDLDTNCYFDGSLSSFVNVREEYYWTATGIFAGMGGLVSLGFNLETCDSQMLSKANALAEMWPVRNIQAD